MSLLLAHVLVSFFHLIMKLVMFMFIFRSSTGLDVSVDLRPKTIRKAMRRQLLEENSILPLPECLKASGVKSVWGEVSQESPKNRHESVKVGKSSLYLRNNSSFRGIAVFA